MTMNGLNAQEDSCSDYRPGNKNINSHNCLWVNFRQTIAQSCQTSLLPWSPASPLIKFLTVHSHLQTASTNSTMRFLCD